MPTYKITDPSSGKTLRLTGDSPPTESELNEIFAAQKPVTPPPALSPETTVPEWGKKYPNLYGAAGAARETLGPVLEAAGLVGGGAAGTAAAGPVGGVGGAGLGYAGVHELLKSIDVALGNRKDKGLIETAKEVPGEVATGAAMEAGGQVAGKAIESGANYLAKKAQPIAEKMYASALKLGTGKSLSQADRAARIKTGLDVGAVPTEKGLAKVNDLIGEIDNAIKTPVTEAAGRGKTVNADRVISHLEGLKETFSRQANPKPDLDIINSTIAGFKEYHGQEIPINVAQEIKTGTYLQLKGKYGRLGNAGIEAEKGLARGLKEEIYKILEEQHPELRELGKKEGAYIALNQSLENAVKRIQNRDIIGIGTPIATSAGGIVAGKPGAVLGFLSRVIDMPQVKSRLAIAISKGARNLKPAMTKAGAYAAGATAVKASQED